MGRLELHVQKARTHERGSMSSRCRNCSNAPGTLATAFAAPFQAVQCIGLAYLLAITTLIVSVGQLGDVIGRRRLLRRPGAVRYVADGAGCVVLSIRHRL